MATYTSNYGWTKPSGSDNVDISVLNDNLDDQDSTIHDAFLNMAPPFSESSTYAVDDIVLYGTGLYKCHTAVVTPGSWTGSTNWQVYKLSEGGSGGGGTSNYNQLTNKPQINSVELSGNKTSSQLGLMASDGVVANPTGQTTGTLTALEVGGTKYAVSSGGTSDYTALSNKPSINNVTLSGNKTTSDLGISYNDLTNKPSIPTKTSDLTNDSNFVSDANYVHTDNNFTISEKTKLAGIESGAEANVQANWNQTSTSADDFIKNKPSLATVATSGSYADLSNKPENANTFQGTIAEWNQLSTAEKKAYDHASIPDSIDGGVTFPANKVVMTGGGNVEDAIITLHGYTDISASVLNPSLSFTATDNCILLLNSSGTNDARPYFNYLVNGTKYGLVGFPNASLDRYVFLRKGDVFKFNDTYPYENTLTNYVYLV